MTLKESQKSRKDVSSKSALRASSLTVGSVADDSGGSTREVAGSDMSVFRGLDSIKKWWRILFIATKKTPRYNAAAEYVS